MRFLPRLQEMGWETTLDTWARVFLVHFLRRRRSLLQIFLKASGVFVDAIHGCSTTLRIGSAPSAIVSSHHVACLSSQQFCDLSQVSCRCVGKTASVPTEAAIEPTLVILL